MGWRLGSLAVVATLLLASAPAVAQEARPFTPDMVDASRLMVGVARFNLIQNDVHNGDWYISGEVNDGVYRVVDGTTLYPDVRESGVWLMSAADFAPQRLSLDADFSRSILEADLAWADGQITGEYRVRRAAESARRTVDFAQPIQDGALFRAAAFLLAPALDFSGGAIALTWFNSNSGRHENVTLVPEGDEQVQTPAGVFQVQRIGVRGGSVENVLYISRGDEPRLVRVDVEGQNMRFEYRGAE